MLMSRNQNNYTLRGANESAVRLESFADFPQRSVARVAAGAFGFLILIQALDGPER